MSNVFIELGLFSAKVFIILLFILIVLITFFALIAKSKSRSKGRLRIKNLSKEYHETTQAIFAETLLKKRF